MKPAGCDVMQFRRRFHSKCIYIYSECCTNSYCLLNGKEHSSLKSQVLVDVYMHVQMHSYCDSLPPSHVPTFQ